MGQHPELVLLFATPRQAPSASLAFLGGAKETRTPDPYNAIVVLYQLSYSPANEKHYSQPPKECQATLKKFRGFGKTDYFLPDVQS